MIIRDYVSFLIIRYYVRKKNYKWAGTKKKKNLEKGVSCGLLFIFIGGCSMSGNILILYACIPKVHTSIVKQ